MFSKKLFLPCFLLWFVVHDLDAAFTGLSYDYVAYNAIAGNVTVRVYAEFSSGTDQLTAIWGDAANPLSVVPSGVFYQNGFGGPTSLSINPVFIPFFPDLAHDSWFTIGLADLAGNAMVISGLNFTAFEAGGSFLENDAVTGQMLTAAGSAQNFPVAGRVLIAQFTTNNDVSMLINLTWRNEAGVVSNTPGISLLVDGGVPGCTDVWALNYNAAATLNDGSCTYPPPSYTGLSAEATGYNTAQPGYNTYRVYAHFAYAGDQLTAVFGQDVTPLHISTSGTFFQHNLGSPEADGINPALYPSFPGLIYDSWVTVGAQDNSYAVEEIGIDFTVFENGGGLDVNDAFGGSWFVFPGTSAAAYPDAQGRVLVAQLTTDGDISLSINLQYRAADGTSPQHLAQNVFIQHQLAGCTDAEATNYNPMAEVDDGTCILPENCTGDFDGNGTINTGDLLLFMAQFGCAAACGPFDLDGNGPVNTGDLLLFMALFGTLCP